MRVVHKDFTMTLMTVTDGVREIADSRGLLAKRYDRPYDDGLYLLVTLAEHDDGNPRYYQVWKKHVLEKNPMAIICGYNEYARRARLELFQVDPENPPTSVKEVLLAMMESPSTWQYVCDYVADLTL